MVKSKRTVREAGFSIIELLVALTILLIMTTFVISAFTSSLKVVRRESSLADRDADVKRALELITIELGQAGATPEILESTFDATPGNNPIKPGSTITAALGAGVSTVRLQNPSITAALGPTYGFYPGRPITLTLPEGSSTSEVVQIAKVNNGVAPTNVGCSPSPCVATVTNTTKTHNAGDYVATKTLPLMFGILNPAPLTSGALPLTSTTKLVAPNCGALPPVGTRLGFVGDILSNGTLQYVEYAYDCQSRRLYRSITPLGSGAAKAVAYPVLDNVQDFRFTLVYPNLATPIPVAVRISITARSTVPEPSIAGTAARYKDIVATTEIVPRGTYAAALIFAAGGENQLRAMLPPCQAGGPSGVGINFAPCTAWNTAPWNTAPGEWSNLLVNYAGKKFDGSAVEALP